MDNDEGILQDTREISIMLSSEDYEVLQKIAETEGKELSALVELWTRDKLREVVEQPPLETKEEEPSPTPTPEEAGEQQDPDDPPVVEPSRRFSGMKAPKADKGDTNSRMVYGPLLIIALLFICGMLIIFSYAGLQELGLIDNGTGVDPATATSIPTEVIATDVPEVVPGSTSLTSTITPSEVPTSTITAFSEQPTATALLPMPAVITTTGSLTLTTGVDQAASGYRTLSTDIGSNLADLIELMSHDLTAIMQVSRTIFLAPNQSITLPITAPVAPLEKPRHFVFPLQPPNIAVFEGAHHDYPATDLFAPAGSPIVAVTDGVIQEISPVDNWDPTIDDPATRGGVFLSLIGWDGYRYYYSHLDRLVPTVQMGGHVVAGQLIGYVGDSGNARGVPHLHFGISLPTYAGDWQTRRGTILPFPYLQAWKNGEGLSPLHTGQQ